MKADYSTPSPRMRRAGWLVVALCAAGLCLRLGFWQLSRAHQKQALAASLAERGAEPVLPVAELARDPAAAGAQYQRRIVLRGRWLAAHTVYLANRTMDGQVGFDVLTPLRLGADDAVVVQRGWIRRDAVDPRKVPPFDTPDGEVEVRGRVAPLPAHWVQLGADATGAAVRQNLDAEALRRDTGLALRPLIVIEQEHVPASPDGLSRHWAAPTVGAERNQGYAVQWFAIAAAIMGLFVWIQFLRPRASLLTPETAKSP